MMPASQNFVCVAIIAPAAPLVLLYVCVGTLHTFVPSQIKCRPRVSSLRPPAVRSPNSTFRLLLSLWRPDALGKHGANDRSAAKTHRRIVHGAGGRQRHACSQLP